MVKCSELTLADEFHIWISMIMKSHVWVFMFAAFWAERLLGW